MALQLCPQVSTFLAMRWYLLLPLVVALSGCNANPAPKARTEGEQKLFGAVQMKIDSFSRVKDWNNSGSPSGVEVFVEFFDRFGDRTKAAGDILFELYDYRSGWQDNRGDRLANPWSAALRSYDQQAAHWDKASGSYMFRLDDPQLNTSHSYVLAVTFETSGARFFQQIVLQPHAPAPTRPETRPGH